jgi:CzcA family heavy metal efflux pump
MNIFSFVLKHTRAIIFVVSILVLAGIFTVLNLPVSIFPDITFPRIVVLADNGEEPAEKIMVEITKPLEETINSLPGVLNVRSTTSRGSAEISVNFEWETDIIQSQQLLQGKISQIRNELPPTASIQVERMNATFFPIMGYALTSDSVSLVQMRDIALYTLRPAISRISGVSQVRVVGGDTKEYLVQVEPSKLQSYGVSIQQVSDAISKTNLVSSVGLMDANYHLYLTLVDNTFQSMEDIKNTVITSTNVSPVFLKDIASITASVEDSYIRVTANGKRAVLINILRQPNGNTVQIASDVEKMWKEVKSQIPAGVNISNFYNQADLVNESFKSVRDSIGAGVVLAIIVLLLFLRNWRITFVAAVVIPITVAITVLLLMAANQTLNIMTLGGIAAAIGLIIDDNIVIIENIFRHFKEGHEKLSDAVGGSVKELFTAVIGSSTSTIIIFLPFAFLSGVTGAFFKSLSLTMALSLIVSLFLSLFLGPLLASRFIHPDDFKKTKANNKAGRLEDFYKKFLGLLIKRKFLLLPVIVLFIIGGYLIYSSIGSGFMPEMDEGAFILDYISPPGTSLNETNRMLMHVEQIIMGIPEVESYSRRTGTQLGFFITEPNNGDYLIKLKKNRSRGVNAIIDELRTKVENSEPALQIEFGQAMQDLIGDLTSVPSPVEIKVFGEDNALIQKKAKEIAALISNVPGVVDVFDGIVISGPAYIINFNLPAVARAGFTVEDLSNIISNDIQGDVTTQIQKGEKLIGVRVRLPDKYRNDLDLLKSIRVTSPNGNSYVLGSLADFRIDPGRSEIDRENLKQMVAVTSRISGRDLGSTVGDIKSLLNKKLILPPGITLEYGGTFRTQQESFQGLLKVLLAASLLVILVLVIEFERFIIPLSIYLVALLSLFGVVLALWITNVSFNISSFMGAIMMVGIVGENSIFLAHYFFIFRKKGMNSHEAAINASVVRSRPIIMTALAAILALMPLALGIGAGSQMQQPLALAVIGGFTISSLLLLFILPVLLSFSSRNTFYPENENNQRSAK